LIYGTLFPLVGWRGMFVIGALPAFLVIYIRTRVDESPAWVQGQVSRDAESRLGKDVFAHLGIFVFMVVLMFAFNSYSHGAQDLYPTFLQKDHNLSPHIVGLLAIIANVGALLGGICFGTWSEKIGRRRAITIAVLLSIPLIPLWVYSRTLPMLALGGFLMQFMVQGAWGVIPAHLNELSPPMVRGTLPGFAYQVGNFFSSRNAVIQARLAENRYGGSFQPVLAWTVLLMASLVAGVTWSGREKRGADLSNTK
jgi:MFS transporter, SHS family, lactate transporter